MTGSLLGQLDLLDAKLLFYVNSRHSPFLDVFFSTISGRFFWLPAYALLLALLVRRHGKSMIWIGLFIAFTILLSDQIASTVLKPLVARLRPCQDPRWSQQLHLVNAGCGGLYGFVSSHAANTFALTSFLWFLSGRKFDLLIYCLLTWATVVSFSRVYLGVHYPGDILCGALLGVAIGMLTARICQRAIFHKINSQSSSS
jgi:undecaprenyl-diphosphatase